MLFNTLPAGVYSDYHPAVSTNLPVLRLPLGSVCYLRCWAYRAHTVPLTDLNAIGQRLIAGVALPAAIPPSNSFGLYSLARQRAYHTG